MGKSGNNYFVKHTLYSGIVLGLTSIVYYVVTYLTDQMANPLAAWLLYPILFAISLTSVFHYRKKYSGGFLTFQRAFTVCYLPYLYSFLINSIYQLFFMSRLMTPAYIDKVINQTRARLQAKGMSQLQIDYSAKISRFFFERPMWALVVAFLSFVFVGAIISVIIAAICRKDNENVAFEDI